MASPKITFFILLLFLPQILSAQDKPSAVFNLEDVRSGWSFFPIPNINYNSDLGLQIGATLDVYDYGKNPSYFPNYKHNIHFQGAYFTRGQYLFNLTYDSSFLIPKVRMVAEVTYSGDPLYCFYGFNGSVSHYDKAFDRYGEYAAYSMSRKQFISRVSFSRTFAKNLRWMAGLGYMNYKMGDLNFKDYRSDLTVFRNYVNAGIIRENEADGGSVLELKGGLTYDSRDYEVDTYNGIWADLFLVGCPDAFNSGYKNLRLCAHFRHYITPPMGWLTIAYHLAYQGTIAGESPYYLMSNIYRNLAKQVYCEGLGGFNTVRGVMAQRLLGEGYAWMNFEIRMRVLNFVHKEHHLGMAVNPFFDCGTITQPTRLDEMSAVMGISIDDLSREARIMHPSVGLGLKLLVDSNVFSIEAAHPFVPGDQKNWLSLTFTQHYVF